MAAVRLLLRRTGVRRPAPHRYPPIFEVEEVFRVDVIAAAFEHDFPALRVRFHFIQPEDPQEADYPLELPEEVFRPGRPGHHVCREPAQRLWTAIYKGWADARPDPDLLADLVDLYGPGPGADCLQDGPLDLSIWGLLKANSSLYHLTSDERELSMELVDWIIDHHPTHSIAALHYYSNVYALIMLRDYLVHPDRTPYPRDLLGDNEQLVLP